MTGFLGLLEKMQNGFGLECWQTASEFDRRPCLVLVEAGRDCQVQKLQRNGVQLLQCLRTGYSRVSSEVGDRIPGPPAPENTRIVTRSQAQILTWETLAHLLGLQASQSSSSRPQSASPSPSRPSGQSGQSGQSSQSVQSEEAAPVRTVVSSATRLQQKLLGSGLVDGPLKKFTAPGSEGL